MMGYYYKFGTARAISQYKNRIFGLIALAVPIYLMAYTYTGFTIFFVATLFVMHHLFDEIELFGAEKTRVNVLSIFSPLIIIVTYLFDIEFDTLIYPMLREVFAVIAIGAFLYTVLKNNNPFALYMTGIGAALATVLYYIQLHDIHLIFAVAISHYLNWYVFVGKKLNAQDKGKFNIYLRDVAIFNVVIISMFFAARNLEALAILNILFFSVPAFYASTLLHCIAMYRPSDFTSLKLSLGYKARA